MVATRNRCKNGLASPPPLEIPLPKARRPRQTKPKSKVPPEEEESETVESSSPTSTPDSSSPPPDLSNPLQEPYRHSSEHNHHTGDCHQLTLAGLHSSDDESEQDNGNVDEIEGSDSEEENNSRQEKGIEKAEEEEEYDDEDLDDLLVKAQVSLKRKAMFEEKSDEPRFNFPKLVTGLDTSNTYIKQQGMTAKVDTNTVVVVEKNNAGSKASAQSALETCEINMNAQKVHISKKQKKEVSNLSIIYL